ncbi:YciI family protein [Lysobacter humi (ex Lee et al. 2017)]
MYIVDLTYVAPLADVDAHLEAHRAYLALHYANGTFLASGPKVPRTGGVILARAASREALLEVLAQDPFHRHGVADYAVTRVDVRAAAPGLEALIDG